MQDNLKEQQVNKKKETVVTFPKRQTRYQERKEKEKESNEKERFEHQGFEQSIHLEVENKMEDTENVEIAERIRKMESKMKEFEEEKRKCEKKF